MAYDVLVTAISGDVSNSILKCLQKSERVKHLYGCDIYQYPCGINKVEKFFQVVPCREEEKYIGQLLDICEEMKVDLIVPANEQEIAVLNRRRDEIINHGIKLLLHPAEVYSLFFDKLRTQELLKELGLPYIPTWHASEYRGQSGFPLIIKDIFDCGSKHLHLVRNEEELELWLASEREQLVQRCVGTEDSEYTVPIFSGDGGKHTVFLPLRRTLSKAGYTNFIEMARLEFWETIGEICRKIATRVSLHGSLDLQMREENGIFYVFECNPRLSGTVNFRRQLGFLDAEWWIRWMEEGDFSAEYRFPERGFIGIRELNEIICCKD